MAPRPILEKLFRAWRQGVVIQILLLRPGSRRSTSLQQCQVAEEDPEGSASPLREARTPLARVGGKLVHVPMTPLRSRRVRATQSATPAVVLSQSPLLRRAYSQCATPAAVLFSLFAVISNIRFSAVISNLYIPFSAHCYPLCMGHPAISPASYIPPPPPDPPAGVRIRSAVLSDIPALSNLYARAFDDNPAYAYVFQYDDGRRQFLAHAWLLTVRLHLSLLRGKPLLVAVDEARGGRIVAGVAADGPKGTAYGGLLVLVPTFLRYACQWVYSYGPMSLWRALAGPPLTTLSREPAEAHSSPPPPRSRSIELQMMAVDPDVQGRGIGSILLLHMLSHLQAETAKRGWRHGFVVRLGTQREINVKFYKKVGFHLRRIFLADPGPRQFKTWAMDRAFGSG